MARIKGRFYRDHKLKSQVIQLKAQGITYAQIGRTFGFSRQRAQQIIRPNVPAKTICEQCGRPAKTHAHHEKYTPDNDQIKQVCASCHSKLRGDALRKILLDQGKPMTSKEAADLLGVSVNWAWRSLKALGIYKPTPTKHNWQAVNWNLPPMVNSRLTGIPANQIANYGRDHQLTTRNWTLMKKEERIRLGYRFRGDPPKIESFR